MSTITFRESLKYGGRLFALWFAVTLVGGGLTVLGGYLAVPEVRGLIASGTGAVETATLAGGLILAFFGLASLIVGNFALVYKFLGDAVSKGIRATSAETLDGAVAVTSEPSGESTDSSPETAAESSKPAETAPTSSDEAVQGPAAVPASEQPTAETVRQPASHDGNQPTPAQEETTEPTATDQSPVDEEPVQASREPATESAPSAQSAAADSTPRTEPAVEQEFAPEKEQPGIDQPERRERTAEEIAFGAEGSDRPSEQPPETEETTAVTDDEWFDEEADPEQDTDRGAETFEEEPTEEADRKNVETANDSSADPLSDQFDE